MINLPVSIVVRAVLAFDGPDSEHKPFGVALFKVL